MPNTTATTVSIAATRNAGLQRLNAFVPNSGQKYARDRNSDYGPDQRSNVSMLSGHLRHRLILETEVFDAVLSRYAQSTAEKFIQEVFWRGYFKGWLEQHPTVWTAYREDVARLGAALDQNKDLAHRYERAIHGDTGIECFDVWSRELVETGYLHNHTRMWFASIWIFTLRLPWQLGADFFYRHLIDGDPASNTLSWRWVGGLHTRGKTYLARPANIEKYTGGRFNPQGQLASRAPPLSEDVIHERQVLRSVSFERPTTPSLVLITEEDGCVEDLFRDLKPVAGITLLATDARSPFPVGTKAKAFSRDAMRNATERSRSQFACPFNEPAEVEDWGPALAEIAQENGARTIATAYAPVGPVAEKLAIARAYLADRGISLCESRREYDELTWPHATRGFFALKKQISRILDTYQRAVTPRLL